MTRWFFLLRILKWLCPKRLFYDPKNTLHNCRVSAGYLEAANTFAPLLSLSPSQRGSAASQRGKAMLFRHAPKKKEAAPPPNQIQLPAKSYLKNIRDHGKRVSSIGVSRCEKMS
jgi:hypothetical protein